MQEAQIPNSELPAIPSKRYFTIGEVSDLCSVKAYILRYWEQEFPSLKPMKRRGNRRYYQREDVLMIRQIRGLLYEEGYTISGARQKLLGSADEPSAAEEAPTDGNSLAQVIQGLEAVLVTLKS
ncbi:MAG: MerR family transcriptional regulator [Thiolinea sp.]